MLLTFLPGKLFIWSLGVFSALFFCSAVWNKLPCLSFCFDFCFCGVRWIGTCCSCEGVSLSSLCELSGFRGRVGSEVSVDGAFPWGALSAVTFIGGKDGDGEVQPGPL